MNSRSAEAVCRFRSKGVDFFSDPRRRESSRSDALDSESRSGTRPFVPRATYRILNIRGLENRARI